VAGAVLAPGLIVFFLVVTLVGTWAAHVAEPMLGEKDPERS
jgi:hypothetical protein